MYYIGIDLGTSAVKLLLMDETGSIANIVSREYPIDFPCSFSGNKSAHIRPQIVPRFFLIFLGRESGIGFVRKAEIAIPFIIL